MARQIIQTLQLLLFTKTFRQQSKHLAAFKLKNRKVIFYFLYVSHETIINIGNHNNILPQINTLQISFLQKHTLQSSRVFCNVFALSAFNSFIHTLQNHLRYSMHPYRYKHIKITLNATINKQDRIRHNNKKI